ncbi:MAG: ribosome-binding factor A [Deltaproteobacteria bacterium]|nr:ribosome-binding factor A [Deltaproteobacteria bacterium]
MSRRRNPRALKAPEVTQVEIEDSGLEPSTTAPESAAVRLLRLEKLVAEELDALVRTALVDPALEGASVTAGAPPADARGARVHVRVPAGRREEDAKAALARASPGLRHALTEALAMKYTPALAFRVDVDLEVPS